MSQELAKENQSIKQKLSNQINFSSQELEDVYKSIAEKQRYKHIW